jgi:hypothetical protein
MQSWSQSKFEMLGEPFHWWLTADSMKDASEVIFGAIALKELKPTVQDLELAREGLRLAHPSHDRRSVYVLLVGFSLENLLKAEYMRLNELSQLVAFAPKPDEREMLRIASEATISWGRYPSGTRHDKGGTSPPECFDLEDFRRAFEIVYWRLTEVITEGWAD